MTNTMVIASAPVEPLEASAFVASFTLAKISHFLFAPDETVYPDLKKLCETVSDSYRDRVVVELLQNAHDAHNASATDGRIRIILDMNEGDWGTLYVANDGSLFQRPNFKALCSPTRTTKTVNEAIGNKGVGFLSTFQVCNFPEIYSRATANSDAFDGYSFRFGDPQDVSALLAKQGQVEDTQIVVDQMPRLYLACPIAQEARRLHNLAVEGFATVVRLVLKNGEAKSAVASQLEKLVSGDPPVHLFLTRLRELTIEVGDRTTTLNRTVQILADSDGFRLQEVECAGHSYIIAQRLILHGDVLAAIHHDVAAQALPESWLDWKGDATVSLAVVKDGPPLAGRMYNFLPMGIGAVSPLAGHLDAPFFATIERLNIQSGVKLNELFLTTARHLAIEAARTSRDLLTLSSGQKAVADLLFWSGDGKDSILAHLLETNEALVPIIAVGSKPRWAALSNTRRWPDDDFLTAKRAASSSQLSILNPDLGPERTSRLTVFAGSKIRLAPNWDEKREVVEGCAEELFRAKAPIATWDAYYQGLGRIFASKPDQLLGLRILLTERNDLVATEAPVTAASKRRPKRLSAMFLPPLRGGESRTDLPRAVRQRLAYLHPELELCRSSSVTVRGVLVASGVVREHQARELLRLLSTAIEETGAAADPEALRWDALRAIMRIAREEQVADSVVSDLNLRIPGRNEWIRADIAYFGRGWQGTDGARLEAMLVEAQGLSAELDAQAEFLIKPYRDWNVASGDQKDWISFLQHAGVRDHLRPFLAFAGAPPRSHYGPPFDEMRRRAALPPDQTSAWSAAIGVPGDYPNPMTPYSITGAYRLPGQADFAALAPIVGRQYAEQVLRAIDADPGKLKMRLFRPNHLHQQHERMIASPIEAFVRGASWVPTVRGLVPLAQAWLRSDSHTAPAELPTVEYDFRTQMLRHEKAEQSLRDLGMPTFGSAASAWRFIAVAGATIGKQLEGAAAERWYSATQEAWSRADLSQVPPANLQLVCRSAAAITAPSLHAEAGRTILLADGDTRQLLAAKLGANGEWAVFEPPASRVNDVSVYLARHFPKRCVRTSSLQAAYVAGGQPLVFDATDPLIEVELGDRLREIVALTIRYGSAFFRSDVEPVLQRLNGIRIRWLDDLSVRVGDIVEPVTNFAERGVFLPGDGPTVLVHRSLKGSPRLLIKISEPLGEGLGSRRLLTPAIVAFVAQFDNDPLDCTYADFARALQIPEDQVRGALGVTRAMVSNLLFLLRPIVAYYSGRDWSDRVVSGGGLLTEEDVVSLLEEVPNLPEEPRTIIRRCREATSLTTLAVALKVDLAKFNDLLEELGPKYQHVDLTNEHAASLQIFLDKRANAIRNAVRETYRGVFEEQGDLSRYVKTQAADRPTLPDGYGRTHVALSQNTKEEWLEQWFQRWDIEVKDPRNTTMLSIETTQTANLRMLRQAASNLRKIVLAKTKAGDPLREKWSSDTTAQQSLTSAAENGGWIDFDRLDAVAALPWLQRAGLWPNDWPTTLELPALDLHESDLDAIKDADEVARQTAALKPRTMQWAAGAFRFGMDSLADAVDQIARMAEGNTSLAATSTRVLQGTAPILNSRPSGGGGGGSGGRAMTRMTQEERDFVGLCGEATAFAWIRKRFGKNRVIDNSCWRSGYSEYVSSTQKGNDFLGYDFEVRNGGTRWYFEVKATSGTGMQAIQSIELGSTEIVRAESCKADGRQKFRILYVTDALHPDRARLFVLPNPRTEEGLRFFAEPDMTGVKLSFELPR
ncbi:sacsin N-terminal ATP-binding-like domain-containing protein [Rhizobium ruizarguesonis]|uniref:sacsin N-terminal ATP-binding-like domain-containing protein n=1 Tax=Rhizobium ruizarguesonis TaxID=2081791 RepID=UPI001031D46E|nr:ATP-binding protein [Rhizobium ruizarguesonis]TBC13026.1 ATP-binding protein [Rhizobium ruizarguesonis]